MLLEHREHDAVQGGGSVETIQRVGVRALKNEATQLLRAVREEGAEYIVTYRGEPVAVLRPFTAEDAERLREAEVAARLSSLRALAVEIGGAWQDERSGVEIVEAQRRG